MGFDDYKVVLYRNQPDGWVAEIPAIPGCYALMSTREEALVELEGIFQLISEEYRDRNECLPVDTTEIVNQPFDQNQNIDIQHERLRREALANAERDSAMTAEW